jgi:hypothetical protein
MSVVLPSTAVYRATKRGELLNKEMRKRGNYSPQRRGGAENRKRHPSGSAGNDPIATSLNLSLTRAARDASRGFPSGSANKKVSQRDWLNRNTAAGCRG